MYPKVKEKEQVIRALKGLEFVRNQHGSLFDRGSADSYYGRPQHPHHRIDGDEVVVTDAESVQEYLAGYAWNEQYGDKKDWG